MYGLLQVVGIQVMPSVSVPVMNMNDLTLMGGGKDTLWMEAGWGKAQGPGPGQGHLSDGDYAQVDTRGLSTFYNTRKEGPGNPTPYATTTLVNSNMVPNNRPDTTVCHCFDIVLFYWFCFSVCFALTTQFFFS